MRGSDSESPSKQMTFYHYQNRQILVNTVFWQTKRHIDYNQKKTISLFNILCSFRHSIDPHHPLRRHHPADAPFFYSAK